MERILEGGAPLRGNAKRREDGIARNDVLQEKKGRSRGGGPTGKKGKERL